MGFAKDGYLFIGAGLRIPVSEIVWRFNPSGGPGGQHANKASTRVEAELNLGRLGINEETKNGLVFLLLYLIIPIVVVGIIVCCIRMKRNAQISTFSE